MYAIVLGVFFGITLCSVGPKPFILNWFKKELNCSVVGHWRMFKPSISSTSLLIIVQRICCFHLIFVKLTVKLC